MDLAALLDCTEAVTCEYLNHEITSYVYTSGPERLSKEERGRLKALRDLPSGLPTLSDKELEALSDDERKDREAKEWEAYAKSIDAARIVLPVVLKGWDLDGTPMEYQGAPFPPTAENVAKCPDSLLQAVAPKVMERWSTPNPTAVSPEQSGSQLTEKSENSLGETISHTHVSV